jgi:arsenate reductase-like glutaredoxin family protein
LLELGAELESRDLDKQPLSETELDALIGTRDYQPFLNPRNELYRGRNMDRKAPSSEEAIRLRSKNPNLIKRPVVVRGERLVLGLDEAAYRNLFE